MLLDLQARLRERVRAAVREHFDLELPEIVFQYPPSVTLGDLALTAPFELAKSLRQKPREIGERLAAVLPDALIRRAEVAGGGYVNLFLDRGAFALELHSALVEKRQPAPRAGSVIVEHTSINPNKAAHIGHLRNAVLGDSFVRVLRSRGHQVGIQNYIDDTGVQLADVVVGVRHIAGKTLADLRQLPGRFDYYCWDLYARVGDFYAEKEQHRKLQAETLHAIEEGGNELAEMGAYIAARIVDCHLATMERLGIRYDLLARESDILRLHFWNRAFELLRERGAIHREEEGKNAGCWVLSMADAGGETAAGAPEARRAGDDDKIIVRSNGTVTYTGKDIAYQLWKLGKLDRDFRYQRHRLYPDGHELWTSTSDTGEPQPPAFGHARAVYNVIDVGQSYPQRVVKAGVAALAGEDAAAASHHLAYEKVVLSPATALALGYAVSENGAAVKVSGRKGLGVKADDLIDALERKARAEIESRDEGAERGPEERDATARAIAVGALRYFLLKYGRNRIITFDMDEALAFVGETGPYVQNSIVRARNIFTKMRAEGHDVAGLRERARRLPLDELLHGEEGDLVWALLLLMARSEEVLELVIANEDVAALAKHAFAIAQAFHSYYQKPQHSLLHAQNAELRAFRVLVVDVFLRQMEALAALLGIPIPERM